MGKLCQLPTWIEADIFCSNVKHHSLLLSRNDRKAPQQMSKALVPKLNLLSIPSSNGSNSWFPANSHRGKKKDTTLWSIKDHYWKTKGHNSSCINAREDVSLMLTLHDLFSSATTHPDPPCLPCDNSTDSASFRSRGLPSIHSQVLDLSRPWQLPCSLCSNSVWPLFPCELHGFICRSTFWTTLFLSIPS